MIYLAVLPALDLAALANILIGSALGVTFTLLVGRVRRERRENEDAAARYFGERGQR